MDQPEFVWLNDDLVPLEQARVSVNDRGFLYGDGLFETIRAEAGRLYFLREHLTRLGASAQAFRLPFPGDLPWETRLKRLLAANGLDRGVARVKILLSRGEVAGPGLPAASRPTLVIRAHPYEPPPPAEYAAGWAVVTFPERRTTFLGRHKSLNYLFYLTARQYALERGAREALILEADGLLSEGAATSLLYLSHGAYGTPAGASALPGVTLAVLTLALGRLGLLLEVVPTDPLRLRQAEGVWLANALLGLMQVASIDAQVMPISAKSDFLQQILWAEAGR